MCYEVVPRFSMLIKVTFLNSLSLVAINKYDKGATINIMLLVEGSSETGLFRHFLVISKR